MSRTIIYQEPASYFPKKIRDMFKEDEKNEIKKKPVAKKTTSRKKTK